jgi:hypothetical protein
VIRSNGRVELTRAQAVQRALDCVSDKDHYYRLGSGGRNPKADRPYDSKGRVDCSGFVSWALGFDRYQHFIGIYGVPEDWWWSTDGLYDDATDRGQLDDDQRYGPGWFRMVAKTEPVLPGDVLVYPDYKLNGVNKQGHTGLIVEVLPGFKRGKAGWHERLLVAHATPSHRLKYGNVVAVTNARAWRKKGYIVRFTQFAGEAK